MITALSCCPLRVHPSACLGPHSSECPSVGWAVQGALDTWLSTHSHSLSLLSRPCSGYIRPQIPWSKCQDPLGGQVQAPSLDLFPKDSVSISRPKRWLKNSCVRETRGWMWAVLSTHVPEALHGAGGNGWEEWRPQSLGPPFISLEMLRIACLPLTGSFGSAEDMG